MSAPSVYKLWISLQCQMIAGCTQGLLVKKVSHDSVRVLARWPDRSPLSQSMSITAKKAAEANRIYMHKDQENGIYFAHPVIQEDKVWGIVVLHLRDRSPKVVQACIRLLKWGFTWLHVFNSALIHDLTKNREKDLNDNLQIYQGLIVFISEMNKNRDLDSLLITVVNKLAHTFHVDRVSLGIFKHKKIELQAVSYSAEFDKRSSEAEMLRHAMLECIERRSDIVVNPVNIDTQTNPQHNILLTHRSLDFCASMLIQLGDQVIGVLTFEKKEAPEFNELEFKSIRPYIDSVAEAIHLRSNDKKEKRHGYGLSRTINFLSNRKHLERMIMGLAACVTLLSFVPFPYHLKGDAVLQSKSRHLLVAPFEGYLANVFVDPGQSVSKGELLATLKDDDLTLERSKLDSRLHQLNLEYDAALAENNRTQAAIVSAQINQTRVQLELTDKHLSRTKLVSPIDGIIISDNIRQSIGAPLEQGNVLIEVARANDFDAQIFIHENDISDITPLQKGKLVLLSFPGEDFEIEVVKVTPISEVKNGSNYFRVESTLTSPLKSLRPGMRGTGKIYIEKRRLGWIWFHDLWHWLRRLLWI